MGRKSIPPMLKLLTGNPGKRQIPVGPDMSTDMPDSPPWLVGYALETWNRLAPGQHALGSLNHHNVDLFAAYCQSVGMLRMAVELQNKRIEEFGMLAGTLEKTTNGNIIQSAIVGTISSALRNIQKLASDFNLPPCKHGLPAPKKSKFDGLINAAKN